DGGGEGLGVAYDDDEPFGAGDGGVKDVTLEHEVMLAHEGQHYSGVFAALRFVDGDGVGEGELVEFVVGIEDGAVLELDMDLAGLLVQIGDDADVAVEYVEVVVV